MEVVLRPATERDLAFSYRVKREAFGPYVEGLRGWDDCHQRRIHDEHFARGNTRIIVVGSEDVGTLRTEVRDGVLHLHQLFVLPSRQSGGIGARCVNLVLEEARARNLPVRLRVMKANPRARAFWERQGFRCEGENETHHLFGHVPHS